MLKATELCKSYGTHRILDHVSLTVPDGAFYSIMGESGSGKSTLLGVLAGNLPADSGCVMLNECCITSLNERGLAKLRRTDLGFVYQSLNLIPTLTGEENILLPLYLQKNATKEKKERLRELAALLNVTGVLSAYPDTMSGGERQRIAITRALLHEPKILMLDEPTGSLDSASTANVMELLCRINQELGITVLQVTHSTAAAAYGSRTLLLRDGVLEGA